MSITEDLLRQRSEHNEGCLSTLEEITLHQFDLEGINEILGTKCRSLKILYLQNNLIEKIENLNHLKKLEYLNLAINSIRKVENLYKNENLTKLDLTVNYIDDLTSVKSLKNNYRLRELHMVGNPCSEYEGYRLYVIGNLPQLKIFDGQGITKTERIKAEQELEKIEKQIEVEQKKKIAENNRKMKNLKPTFNEEGKRVYGNDPISRKLAAKEMKKEEEMEKKRKKEKEEEEKKKKRMRKKRMEPEEEIEKYGKIMQKNEGKWKFKFFEREKEYVLDIPVGRFCLTNEIDIDVQPKYVTVDIRKKRLCLRFDKEVNPDETNAQRSQTTGHLKLTVPFAREIIGK